MAVAGVQHHWAVTRGNNPDTKPYYCPLHESRHFAAVTLYQRLIQPVPDNASDYWTRLADMAVVIPEQEASFFYQLSLLAQATWTPVDHDTDLDAILAKARTELATHPTPTISGDHAAPRVLGRPAITTTPTLTNIKTQGTWAVTLETDDPNDGVDDIWVSPIYADEPPTTYTQARDRYLTVAKDLNRVVPPDPEPTTGIRFWYTLETSASTPWYPDDINIDPTQAINQLYNQLTQ